MNLIYSIIFSFLVSGCFFDNKTEVDPNKQIQKSEFVGGTIIMQDLHGIDKGADAEARFGVYKVEQKQKMARFYRGLGRSVTATSSPCTVSRTPRKSASSNPDSSQSEAISVGKLSFGPAASQSLLEMKESEKHGYQYLLNENLAPGLYQFIGEGKDKAPKFGEVLSLPEDLTEVMANGFNFSKEPVNIKKSENLKVSWNSTSFENENDTVMLTVLTNTEEEYIDLNCKIQERLLTKSDKMTTWEISKEEFKDMPLTGTNLGTIGLLRFHVLERRNKEPLLNLIGIRMYNTIAGIGE